MASCACWTSRTAVSVSRVPLLCPPPSASTPLADALRVPSARSPGLACTPALAAHCSTCAITRCSVGCISAWPSSSVQLPCRLKRPLASALRCASPMTSCSTTSAASAACASSAVAADWTTAGASEAPSACATVCTPAATVATCWPAATCICAPRPRPCACDDRPTACPVAPASAPSRRCAWPSKSSRLSAVASTSPGGKSLRSAAISDA